MQQKLNFSFLKDPVWGKVISLSFIIFFALLADAILSSWVPDLVENSFSSPVVMGFILSFSSIVGLGADLVFPQILKNVNFKILLLLAIILSLIFSLTLISATYFPFVLVFLLGMAIWGIYYEIIGFANHQFVADAIPIRMHTSTWAFLGVFRNLAYFLGPLIAGFLITYSVRTPAYFALIFALISLVILFAVKKHHERKVTIELDKMNFTCELEHWGVLYKKVWPIVIMSITLGIIDAVFWTIGAVYTVELTRVNFWGRWFLPIYALPSLFVGFIVAKKGIVQKKKRMAIKFFLLSGLFLGMMSMYRSIFWQLMTVFCSSLALAITYPLLEGIYSDIIRRMGRQRRHMIGLCNSTTSVSYIVGPIIAGFVDSRVGSIMTFVYLGYAVITIALFLLAFTPRKLRLPQKKIGEWKD